MGLRSVCRLMEEAQRSGDAALAECQLKLRESGVCEVVVKALQHHASDAVGVRHGVAAITLLALDNHTNRSALAAAGACQAVASVLRRCTADEATLQSAAASVTWLAQCSENCAGMVAGACEGLVKVLEMKIGNKELVLAALEAVQEVSSRSSECGTRLVAAGACAAVLRVLYASGDDTDRKAAALTAMTHLAETAASREFLSTPGACAAVLAALKAHPTHEPIQRDGVDLISKLADGSSARSARLLAAGVCEVLVEGLGRTWLRTPLIAEGALLATTNLFSTPPKGFDKYDALCRAVLRAMGAHRQDVDVQLSGLNTVEVLALIDAARAQLRARRCNALNKLKDSVVAHRGNAEVLAYFSHARFNLEYDPPATPVELFQHCCEGLWWCLSWHMVNFINGMLRSAVRAMRYE
ncbi:armadillo-type protein [Tribonema minus]|uniref:Armadillo-type protein n=1 Tax=Tribonema minus TaxID=303371 RepID=A0A835YJE4_9STRA|nr:armadillo-type protein [Tribonema minus]